MGHQFFKVICIPRPECNSFDLDALETFLPREL